MDERVGKVGLELDHPSIRNPGGDLDDEHWQGKLQPGHLDRQLGQVGLRGLHEREAAAFGVSAVIAVDHFSLRKNGNQAADADRDEAQPDMNVMVAVDLGELGGHVGADGAVGSKGDRGEDQHQPNLFLEIDD